MLSEKAKSRAQQRFFGMVRAAQKGEMDNPSSEVLDAADSMKVSDVKKFAKTKHKGLPEKKKIEEGASIIQGRSSGKKVGYRGPTGDHKRDKHGHIVASHYKSNKTASKVTTVKKKSSTQKSPGFTPKTGEEKKDTLRRFNNYEKLKKQIHARDDARKKANQEQPKKPKGKLRQKGDTWRADWSTHKHYKPPTKKKKLEEVAFLAGLAKGAAVAAKGAIKGAVKQKAKQVVQQKAAQVASGAIPQPNMSEGKGTAELARLSLRGKKRCAKCGSFTHVTGDCPKKDHPVTESNKYKGVLENPMKEVTKEGVLTRLGRKKKVEEKKPKKAMDAGARAKRLLQRKIHAKYVSGSQDLVPDDIRDHYEVSEDHYRGTGEKVQARTLAWMRKKGQKGAPGLDAMKAREAEHKAKRGVKKEEFVDEAKVDKGRSDYGKATIRNWRHSGPSTVEPAMFDPENKRGKTIDKRREEHKARRGKKGAKVPVYTKEDKVPPKVPLKNTGNPIQNAWNKFVPPIESSNSPCVRSGKCTPGKLEAPLLNKMNKTTEKINQPIKNISKTAKSVSRIAKVAAPVAAGLAVSKGVDSLMKLGKKKKAVKEQNLDEFKLFGKKDSGAIFYNDPKARRDALQKTGTDPGSGAKEALTNTVNKAKTNVTNTVKTKVKSVVTPVKKNIQRNIDTQTNRAGANIGNQISTRVKPAVSSGVADGIKQGATAVGKAALKGAASVGGGLAVSKGVDSLMKGGKKKERDVNETTMPNVSSKDKKAINARAKNVFKKDLKGDHVSVNEGVVDAIKKGNKRHKDAVEKKKIKNRKAVPYAALAASHEPEGDNIEEGKGKAAVTGALGNIAGRAIGGAVAGPAGAVVGKYAGAALGAAAGAKKGRRKSAAVGGALGSALPGAGLGLGSGAGAALAASHEPEGELVDETYFDTNRRGISTKGGFVKQYNKPGKLSRASLNHERKSKNPELRMSKKELRTSMIDDANYEKKMGRSKPTPSNLKTALKKQSANEELSIVDKMLIEFSPTPLVLEKKKQPSVHDDYYDPMEDPYFDPHEAEATRGQSGRGTKGKMNVRKKYPVK